MRTPISYIGLMGLMVIILAGLFLSGCQESVVDPTSQTDDEYLQSTAIQSVYSNDPDDEDNLMASEIEDFESEGAVEDYPGADPIDSLIAWGQKIINSNENGDGRINYCLQ